MCNMEYEEENIIITYLLLHNPLQQNVPYPVQNQASPEYPPAGPPSNQAYPPPTVLPSHDGTGNE